MRNKYEEIIGDGQKGRGIIELNIRFRVQQKMALFRFFSKFSFLFQR